MKNNYKQEPKTDWTKELDWLKARGFTSYGYHAAEIQIICGIVLQAKREARERTIRECAGIAERHKYAGLRSRAGDEIATNILALLDSEPKIGQTICRHGSAEPMFCKLCSEGGEE